jgi:hypothetical protein
VRLYRVLPYASTARTAADAGHPLYRPPAVGANRIDNPDLFQSLYVGDDPACAVAEAFGWASRWGSGLLRGSPSIAGSVRALITFDLPDDAAICDLDDARRLVTLGLKPSNVVTRDRSVTQRWARSIYDGGQHAGVRWWSYYNPDWGSIGLWDVSRLTIADVEPLTMAHPAVTHAAAAINRIIET